MSGNDSGSSSDDDADYDGEFANPALNICFLLTEAGNSLNFVLLADNMTASEVTQVRELIEEHIGTISTSKQDVFSHSVVLVPDEATSWNYSGEVFKLSYVHDCINAGKILNINDYLKDPPSKLYVDNFDFMDVIYHRKYSWNTIPDNFKLPNSIAANSTDVETHAEPVCQDSSDSASSVDSVESLISVRSDAYPQTAKQTKSQYSYAEKEAMVKYVIEHNFYTRVKGKQLYKEMEAANICPIRTWQSMKDHFLRCLVKEIPQLTYLTAFQKKKLLDALAPYK